jgi:sterol desaturase/sphingolipid hydroxylase (fatty acid hydroxylase superfamily)
MNITIFRISIALFSFLLPWAKKNSGSWYGIRILVNIGLFGLWNLIALSSNYGFKMILQPVHRLFPGLLNINFGFGTLPLYGKIALGFLVCDLAVYTIHRLEHKFPFLWRFHQVHHSDSQLDLSSHIRKHPLCGIYATLIFVVFMLVFGFPLISFFAYNIVGDSMGFLSHSGFAFPTWFYKLLERLCLISPRNHELHHSVNRREHDSNYGQVFSIWDHLFGTYQNHPHHQIELGLSNIPKEKQNFMSLLLLPFKVFK